MKALADQRQLRWRVRVLLFWGLLHFLCLRVPNQALLHLVPHQYRMLRLRLLRQRPVPCLLILILMLILNLIRLPLAALHQMQQALALLLLLPLLRHLHSDLRRIHGPQLQLPITYR